MATVGLEILFSSVKTQISSCQDALVCCLHWNLIVNGFKNIGSGDQAPRKGVSVKKSELLPANWSESQDVYSLLYQPSTGNDTHILKVVRMDNTLLVHLMRTSDESVSSITLNVDDYTTDDLSTFESVYKDISKLERLFKKELIDTLSPQEPQGSQASNAQADRSHPRREEDPLRVPPRHGDRQPPDWGEPSNPFSIGRGDLDPLAGGRGGGMLMDPSRGGFPLGGGMNPDIGLPGPARLPRGAVPPGARFDPFGPPPPDLVPSGEPRGGHRVGPDNDHLPPPGYDDMFM
ncbi:unnamed protein product [Owenia fusiformis]|uniref:Proteasome inhibitor PI31 subunit n=1 Tax=Owenia fusiformis TaxID=6347 RepID=A0A8S4N065_OWEFU|nr:unnamed protein product [Owenia fusiformis]